MIDIWIVSLILIAVVILLITEKLSVDVTAIGIIVILSVTGILSPLEAVSGFSNPAVITVAAMFLISSAMVRTGAVSLLSDRVVRISRGNTVLAVSLIFSTVAVSSAFINNTPVVVLFIPVLMGMCCEYGLSPSKLLIPLSYISILAGTCTLIGTSTNIIVSDISAGAGFGEIGMFELAKVGLPIAILGVVFVFLGSKKLLPEMVNPTCELENSEHRKYLSQLRIIKNSSLLGTALSRSFPGEYADLEVIELVRHGHIFYPGRDAVTIVPGDMLLVKGTATELMKILRENEAVLPDTKETPETAPTPQSENMLVEVIIPPQSSFLGERLRDISLFQEHDIQIIAAQRKGFQYTEKRINDIRLKVGDILLVQLPWKKLDELRGFPDFIMVEDVHHRMINTKKAPLAGFIFLCVVTAAATGFFDIMTSAVTGVFLLFLTRCVGIRDAYRSIQGNILVLIAGTIALGFAMEKTGTSELYARAFLGLFEGSSPIFILGAFILLTSISTQLLSNNATAILILPVAISTAIAVGLNPRPFIIGVCIGASACFATPIGYQTNLLVYGPGGYRFTDYFKIGMPLNLIVLVMGTFLIPIFWPF
jgi:di/tricarboxylate transporter